MEEIAAILEQLDEFTFHDGSSPEAMAVLAHDGARSPWSIDEGGHAAFLAGT